MLKVRLLIVFYGVAASLLLAVVPRLGTIVQAIVTIMGLFGAPLLGIFMRWGRCRLSKKANGTGRRPDRCTAGSAVSGLVALLLRAAVLLRNQLHRWISFVATMVTYM